MIDEESPGIEHHQAVEDKDAKKEALVPVPEHHLQLNQAEAKKWVDSEPDPRFKAIKQKLIDNLQLVPHEVFVRLLERCVRSLNEQLAGQGDYVVLWDTKPHSSKRWLYEQVGDLLDPQPQEARYFGSYDQMGDYQDFRKLLDKGIDTFVVMDDAVYSGEQFINKNVLPLLKLYKEYGYYPPRTPKIFLVAPYMTDSFREKDIIKNTQKEGLLQIITEQSMPTLAQILTEEERQVLGEREDVLDIPEQQKKRRMFDPNHDNLYYGATLTAFDHRVADAHSFCEPLAHRLGFSAEIPYKKEDTAYHQLEEEEYRAYQDAVYPELHAS